jgi:hypothetical protein
MQNYWTPHFIKENFENFFIPQFNYTLLSQVYCVWQVVKTPTIVSNNPVFVWNKSKGFNLKTGVKYECMVATCIPWEFPVHSQIQEMPCALFCDKWTLSQQNTSAAVFVSRDGCNVNLSSTCALSLRYYKTITSFMFSHLIDTIH